MRKYIVLTFSSHLLLFTIFFFFFFFLYLYDFYNFYHLLLVRKYIVLTFSSHLFLFLFLLLFLFLFLSLFLFHLFIFFSHFHFPASGQAVVTGVVPSSPRFLPSFFIAHIYRFSNPTDCSSIFHRVLLTHALALSASQSVHKIKSLRIYTSICIHSGGFELTKLTYTRLEDNLIRHRGDRQPFLFLFFLFTLLLFSFWTTSRGHRCRPLSPGSCLQFLSRIGSSNPTARRFFIECC